MCILLNMSLCLQKIEMFDSNIGLWRPCLSWGSTKGTNLFNYTWAFRNKFFNLFILEFFNARSIYNNKNGNLGEIKGLKLSFIIRHLTTVQISILYILPTYYPIYTTNIIFKNKPLRRTLFSLWSKLQDFCTMFTDVSIYYSISVKWTKCFLFSRNIITFQLTIGVPDTLVCRFH